MKVTEKGKYLVENFSGITRKTAKDKAKDLVEKIYQCQWRKGAIEFKNAKKCALVAVDEILNQKSFLFSISFEDEDYWKRVKQEIEKSFRIMTLQQKLNDTIITNIYIAESENRMCYDYNHLELAEECEKVVDDFAIGFVEWFADNTLRVGLNAYKSFGDTNEIKTHTVKEILEIYKKEKSL